MPKNTDLYVLMFLSCLSGCLITFWLFIAVSWNEIQTEIEGNLFSGVWYSIPFIIATLMTICIFIGTIQAYRGIKKGV